MHDRLPAIRRRVPNPAGRVSHPPAAVARASLQALRGERRRGQVRTSVETFQPGGSLAHQVSADRGRFAIVVTTVDRSGHMANAELEQFQEGR